jgi:hypothetical protein
MRIFVRGVSGKSAIATPQDNWRARKNACVTIRRESLPGGLRVRLKKAPDGSAADPKIPGDL